MELRLHPYKHSGGFTLLESLIALVIFSVALLALAGMYAKTLSMSHSTYLRALASIQAMDLEERIRANPLSGIGSDGQYNAANDPYTSIDCSGYTSASSLEPQNISGNANQVANYDEQDWCGNTRLLFENLLVSATTSAPGYTASSTGPVDIEIQVVWRERAIQADNDVEVINSEGFNYTVRK